MVSFGDELLNPQVANGQYRSMGKWFLLPLHLAARAVNGRGTDRLMSLNPSLLRTSFAIGSVLLGGALLVSGCGGGGSGPTSPTATPLPSSTPDPSATSTPVPTTIPVGTFADEFNAGSLDRSKWVVSDSSFKIQRTQFGNQPTFGQDTDGTRYMRVPLSTFIPTGATTTTQLYGTEVFANQKVARGSGVVFEARMRLTNPAQKGLVASFFLLGQKGTYGVPADPLKIDEIDHEILTNGIADNSPYTWTNSYNDFILEQPNVTPDSYTDNRKTIGAPEPIVAGYNAGNWNLYRVVWQAGKVEWFINNQLIRTETSQVVPDDALGVRFNLWGAADAPLGWQQAFDASLAPVTTAAAAQTYGLDVDWVHVTPLTANTTGTLKSVSGLRVTPITSADRAHAGGAGYRSKGRR